MTELLTFENVHLWVHHPQLGRQQLLHDVDWRVRAGERWALLGRNGAGKSTVLSLAGALRHPSAGAVRVLGRQLGQVDVRTLRATVGTVNPQQRIPDELTVGEYVLTGATGTVQLVPGKLTPDDEKRAAEVITHTGLDALAERPIGVCSQGERARARLARALVPSPPLLLLDEPTAALDLPAREELLAALDTLAAESPDLALVMVSHHVEELPGSTSHAMLLRGGRVARAGHVSDTLTSEHLSAAFGFPLSVTRAGGRWQASGTHHG